MATAVGIDLGTTNSAIAALVEGVPTVIPTEDGAHNTPSVVAFTEPGERLVGWSARQQAITNPTGTVSSAKRFIGRRFDQIRAEIDAVPFEVAPGPAGSVRFGVLGTPRAPEEVSALILRNLAENATRHLGQPVTHAVITVPAYFDDAQRQATKDAGRIAGLEVLRIINEPTAAALAYGLGRRARETVLMVDMGGGTFDVSVLDVGDGVVEVRATAGDTHLGGDDFDRRLVDQLADEFQRREGIDPRSDPQALQRLFMVAEQAKIALSSATETVVDLPALTDGEDPRGLRTMLTRAAFERLIADLLERCVEPVRQVLADARMAPEDLDEVILVGGSTRIPAVRELIGRLTGREPDTSVNPDEVVALGAAMEAAMLIGEVDDVLCFDVTPLSLGLETVGGLMTTVIERNTTIPARRTETFSTAEDNQPAADIVVLQGNHERAVDNHVLGRFRLEHIRPAPRGVPEIEVTYTVDANGILNVAARDRSTGVAQRITISERSTLDREELERLAAEMATH